MTPPTLEFEAASAGTAIMEQPVKLAVASPSYKGAAVASDTFKGAVVVFRKLTSGSAEEVWDEKAKSWSTSTSSVTIDSGVALAPGEASWTSQIVPSAAKDSAGASQFAKAVGGYPAYTFKAFFVALDDSASGLSGPSASLSFVPLQDATRLVIGPGEDEKSTSATMARVILKDSSLATIGQIIIQESGGSSTITLENSAGARIVMGSDGGITITPAAGRSLNVAGDIFMNGLLVRTN